MKKILFAVLFTLATTAGYSANYVPMPTCDPCYVPMPTCDPCYVPMPTCDPCVVK